MDFPICYDPVYQAEKREASWDKLRYPSCCLCGSKIFPGEKVYSAHNRSVCADCKEELDDNMDIY